MDISISQAKPDKEELYSFLKKVDNDFSVPLSKKRNLLLLANKLVQKSDIISARTQDGLLVGIIAGYVSNAYSDVGYISIVAVLREYRGRGIASKMIDAFLSIVELYAMEIKAVDLYTSKDNDTAKSVYLKAGFEEYSPLLEERPEDVHMIKYIHYK